MIDGRRRPRTVHGGGQQSSLLQNGQSVTKHFGSVEVYRDKVCRGDDPIHELSLSDLMLILDRIQPAVGILPA